MRAQLGGEVARLPGAGQRAAQQLGRALLVVHDQHRERGQRVGLGVGRARRPRQLDRPGGARPRPRRPGRRSARCARRWPAPRRARATPCPGRSASARDDCSRASCTLVRAQQVPREAGAQVGLARHVGRGLLDAPRAPAGPPGRPARRGSRRPRRRRGRRCGRSRRAAPVTSGTASHSRSTISRWRSSSAGASTVARLRRPPPARPAARSAGRGPAGRARPAATTARASGRRAAPAGTRGAATTARRAAGRCTRPRPAGRAGTR